MQEEFRCEFISWAGFYNLSRKLCHRIHASGFKPDIIIAIGRGGFMPARIISDFLHIMNLTSFKIEHYRGTQKKTTALVKYPLARGVAGNHVLLVDDVCDTGDTFEVASNHIRECLHPKVIRTAVMHYKKTSSFVPDFYAARIIKWRWIIYPWAAAEDVGEFIKQMEPRPESPEEVSEKLVRNYGVRLQLDILKDILAMSNS